MSDFDVKVAGCATRQWALDFEGNKRRIIKSIKKAKAKGAHIRFGGELEITGYGCEDHFYEIDTMVHAWQVILEILASDLTSNMVVITSMPVTHKGSLYSCAIILHNRKILGIRPKKVITRQAEKRYFVPFDGFAEEVELPIIIRKITGQNTAILGDFVFELNGSKIGLVIGDEFNCLKDPKSERCQIARKARLVLCLDASPALKGAAKMKLEELQSVSKELGLSMVSSNLLGADGTRNFYDGQIAFVDQGKLIKENKWGMISNFQVVTSSFSFHSAGEMENTPGNVKLIIEFETQGVPPLLKKTAEEMENKMEEMNLFLKIPKSDRSIPIPETKETLKKCLPHPSLELAELSAMFLWDFLCRTKASGFFLGVSGGQDSGATVYVVYTMCLIIQRNINSKHGPKVLKKLRKLVSDPHFTPKLPQEIMSRILFTAFYQNTETSSADSQKRARLVAEEVGCSFRVCQISDVLPAYVKTFQQLNPKEELKYLSNGGTKKSDTALQNMHSRCMMVSSYLMAQLLPNKLGISGFLLVLSSIEKSELLSGYFTKYDNSSGDISPIYDFSKKEVQEFLQEFGKQHPELTGPAELLKAFPTPELQPLNEEGLVVQKSDWELGLNGIELDLFGRLRKEKRCGPLSMYLELEKTWSFLEKKEVAQKVKTFYLKYARNRHKITVVTPGVNLTTGSADDSRFDLRPFYYPLDFQRQFEQIDRLAGLEKE